MLVSRIPGLFPRHLFPFDYDSCQILFLVWPCQCQVSVNVQDCEAAPVILLVLRALSYVLARPVNEQARIGENNFSWCTLQGFRS